MTFCMSSFFMLIELKWKMHLMMIQAVDTGLRGI